MLDGLGRDLSLFTRRDINLTRSHRLAKSCWALASSAEGTTAICTHALILYVKQSSVAVNAARRSRRGTYLLQVQERTINWQIHVTARQSTHMTKCERRLDVTDGVGEQKGEKGGKI